VDRCALFVDAGYALADGALAVHGTRHRDSVTWDYAGLLKLLAGLSRDRTGLPVLRCYWYDATVDSRRTAEHDTLADIPGLKLRLGKVRPGRREGVETEIRRDLTALARNKAVSDVIIVSGEEDLAQVISDVQDQGLRVALVHIAAGEDWTVSRSLRQECDDIIEISAGHLSPYVDLIPGAEPAVRDEEPVHSGYRVRESQAGMGSAGPGTQSLADAQHSRLSQAQQNPATQQSPVPQPSPAVQQAPAPREPESAPALHAQPVPAQPLSGSSMPGSSSLAQSSSSAHPGASQGPAASAPAAPSLYAAPASGEYQPVSSAPGGSLPPRLPDRSLNGSDAEDSGPGQAPSAPASSPVSAGSDHGDQGRLNLGGSPARSQDQSAPPTRLPAPYQSSEPARGSLPQNGGLPSNGLPQGGISSNGIGHNGLPQNGLPQNGLPQNGLPQNGLPQNGLPRNGLPQNGLPQNRFSSNGISHNGMSHNGGPQTGHDVPPNGALHNGLPASGLPQNGLPQQNGLSQNGLSQNGLSQNGMGQNGMAQGNGYPGNGLSGNGSEHNGLSRDGLSHDGLPPGNGMPGGGFSGNGLPQGGLPPGEQPLNRLPSNGMAQGSGYPGNGISETGPAHSGLSQGHLTPPNGLPQGGFSQHSGPGPSGTDPLRGGGLVQPGPGSPRQLPPGSGQQYPSALSSPYGGQLPPSAPSAQGAPPPQQPTQSPYGGSYGAPSAPSYPTQASAPYGTPQLPAPQQSMSQQSMPQPPMSQQSMQSMSQPISISLPDAVQSAHAEGGAFGEAVAREAPALWLEAVLARKPRMPSDLEARLLQGSALPIDSLLHDEVRHALRRGFWDALERSRR
jgi:hypothetical protein